MKILMLHGINHNMFGKRDPVQYGTITLAEINESLQTLGAELGAQARCAAAGAPALPVHRLVQPR